MIDCDPLVAEALNEALRQRIGLPRYALWFENKTRISWNDDQLLIGVPNLFYQEWLEKTFADDIGEVSCALLGQRLQLRFAIDPRLFQAARNQQEQKSVADADDDEPQLPTKPTAPAPAEAKAASKGPRRFRSLDDFVVGTCNRVAHAAALYAVEAPDQGPNPLVVHGPVGTGKTHLLEGIYGGLRKLHSSGRVVFTTSEEFTNRFQIGRAHV